MRPEAITGNTYLVPRRFDRFVRFLNIKEVIIMDYEFYFYAFIWFVAGFFVRSCLPIYIGTDEAMYKKAGFGILLTKRT